MTELTQEEAARCARACDIDEEGLDKLHVFGVDIRDPFFWFPRLWMKGKESGSGTRNWSDTSLADDCMSLCVAIEALEA